MSDRRDPGRAGAAFALSGVGNTGATAPVTGCEALRLDRQLCFPIYAAANLLGRAYRPLLAQVGLTYPQYLVMLVLWQDEAICVGDLGRRLFLDSGTITPLLKRMEGRGLLLRLRDGEDERRVFVRATPQGMALRDRVERIPATLAGQVAGRLGGPAAVAQLRDGAQRLVAVLADDLSCQAPGVPATPCAFYPPSGKFEDPMTQTTLYGFDGSTYVRTLRCVLARKGIGYDLVPVNVLTGETRTPEHLARHPFGKVPVLDIDGMRLRETDAIVRYLETRTPQPAMFPADGKARAKADETACLINSYGYDAIIGFVAYHLFPDLVGGRNEESRKANLAKAVTLAQSVVGNMGAAPFIAGDAPGYADYLLGPLVAYAAMTEDGPALLAVPGLRDWWDRLSADETFKATAPALA